MYILKQLTEGTVPRHGNCLQNNCGRAKDIHVCNDYDNALLNLVWKCGKKREKPPLSIQKGEKFRQELDMHDLITFFGIL